MTELRLRYYLADIYEQTGNIMKATGRMSYEEFLGDSLYNAGLIRFFEIIGKQQNMFQMTSGINIRTFRGEKSQDFVTG